MFCKIELILIGKKQMESLKIWNINSSWAQKDDHVGKEAAYIE